MAVVVAVDCWRWQWCWCSLPCRRQLRLHATSCACAGQRQPPWQSRSSAKGGELRSDGSRAKNFALNSSGKDSGKLAAKSCHRTHIAAGAQAAHDFFDSHITLLLHGTALAIDLSRRNLSAPSVDKPAM
jgi:hypothetical protein